MPPKLPGLTRYAPAIASCAALVLYATLAIIMWRIFYSPSWDLGIFTQLLTLSLIHI